MAEKLGARKNSSWKAICTAPDFCKTPVGSSTPPIPYPVIADLGQSAKTVPSVRFNGDPCLVLDQSIVPKCTGDEPGTAKGVKSGTVADKVEPTSASSTVRAGKKRVVRELDPCTLNSGNCPGIFVTQPAPGCSIGAGGKPQVDTNPHVTPNEREKSCLEKLGAWWNQKKAEMGAAAGSPGQGAIGALKDTANTVPELGEMMTRGATLNQAAEMEQAAAIQRLFGLKRSADQLQSSAEALRQGADAITLPKFELSNPAQAGGANIAMGLQLLTGLAGLAKGAAKAGTKALVKSGGRALAGEVDDVARVAAKGSTAAREVKAADNVGDAATQAVKKADGFKVKPRPPKPRKPNVKKWIEEGGTVKHNPDGSVVYTNKDGVSVKYNREGYPEFGPHSQGQVDINMTGKRSTDFANADRAFREQMGDPTWKRPTGPDGLTWHHVENGKTMQLVPTSVHSQFQHTGGVSVVTHGGGG